MATATGDEIYTRGLRMLQEQGLSVEDATIATCHRYLDGKPGKVGQLKISQSLRDRAFWTGRFWPEVPDSVFRTEAFALALGRYFQQEPVSATDLLRRVFEIDPKIVQRAVRYSQLFLRQGSRRWSEVQELASPEESRFIEFLRACRMLAEQARSLDEEAEPPRRRSPS